MYLNMNIVKQTWTEFSLIKLDELNDDFIPVYL